jgi:hypothetical protein
MNATTPVKLNKKAFILTLSYSEFYQLQLFIEFASITNSTELPSGASKVPVIFISFRALMVMLALF